MCERVWDKAMADGVISFAEQIALFLYGLLGCVFGFS